MLTFLMAYFKATFKRSGYKASPCFRPFWTRKLSDKYVSTPILTYVLFKHILRNLTNLTVTPNSQQSTLLFRVKAKIIDNSRY
jgi:hypothetical protein